LLRKFAEIVLQRAASSQILTVKAVAITALTNAGISEIRSRTVFIANHFSMPLRFVLPSPSMFLMIVRLSRIFGLGSIWKIVKARFAVYHFRAASSPVVRVYTFAIVLQIAKRYIPTRIFSSRLEKNVYQCDAAFAWGAIGGASQARKTKTWSTFAINLNIDLVGARLGDKSGMLTERLMRSKAIA